MPATTRLSYDRPAPDWLSALPLGNGTLAAMCWGGPDGERIGLNHESAWSGPVGGPITTSPRDAPERVARARALTLAGQPAAAEELLRSVVIPHTQAYLPVGELFVRCESAGEPNDNPHPDEYQRGLDLRSGTAWVTRRWPRVRARQVTRISHPAGALLHSVSGSAVDPGDSSLLNLEVRLQTPLRVNEIRTTWEDGIGDLRTRAELPWDVSPWHPGQADLDADDGPIRWGPAGSDLTREVLLCVLLSTDGRVEDARDHLRVRDASWAEIVLTGEVTGSPRERRTSPSRARRGEQAARQAQARARLAIDRGPVALVAEHQADFASLMDGFTLDLGGESSGRTTDTLIDQVDRTAADERELLELLVQYARYLLISGSRPGTLPLTLQGRWNAERQPPWSSNYTVNINLPMAYWACEAFGLPACHEPLLDLIQRLSVTGAQAAQEVYGLRGWTVHHNTDLWAQARPVGGGWVDPAWSNWPLGGAWLGLHLGQHVAYAADPVAAATEARPVLAGAVRFALDWLTELPDGSLGTAPSTSPENRWITEDGVTVAVGVSSTGDLALITGLLQTYLAVLALIEGKDALGVEAEAALARIPTPGIGRRGELLEWQAEVTEAEPEHRHTSHLIGLYPLDLIDPERTPDQAAAAARSLELRGPESTGWALAWRICLWARLRRPDQVATLVGRALRPADPGHEQRGGLYPNLFSAHPPFQVDGNLGLAAGVLEALLQSDQNSLRLLPARPSRWPTGRVTGLHTRAGLVVDLSWADGRPTEVLLRALRPAEVTVHFDGWEVERGPFRLEAGQCRRVPVDSPP